jgi:hypothetical protein
MFENREIVTAKAILGSIGEPNAISMFWSSWSVGDNPYSSACPRQYLGAYGNDEVQLFWNGHR